VPEQQARDPLRSIGHRLVLGRYRVLERVAVGGLSVLYRGEDVRLPRHVCIKVLDGLRPGKQSPRVARATHEHFIQEAYALSRLSDPHTLRIYDFGYLPEDTPASGTPVQVSEFLEGGTLRQLVRAEGALSLEKMLEITRGLGQALAEAHGHGIIHRDLKPPNILFSTSGRRRIAKLADFGIAAVLDHVGGLRVGGAGVSKLPMYSMNWAAPEQLCGEETTAASDIYSLALLVVYMLAGDSPMRAEELGQAVRQREQARRRIERLLTPLQLPEQLLAVLTRASQRDPSQRPRDVEHFVADLERACPPAPVEASEAGAARPATARETPACASTTGNKITLSPYLAPPPLADRELVFVPFHADAVEVPLGTARLRISVVPENADRICLHIKGVDCFIQRDERPPSSAVLLRESARLRLLRPDNRTLADGVLQLGQETGTDEWSVEIGDSVAIMGKVDCSWVAALEFADRSAVRVLYGEPMPRPVAVGDIESSR
jgi:serine/threonine protein kinase